MRAAVIGILLVVVITAVGCVKKPTPEPSNAQPVDPARVTDVQPPKPSPKLWLDNQAADMVKAVLGYSREDDVYVIRWEHVDQLHGWVKLDPKVGSEPVSYDLTILPSDILKGSKAVATHREFGLSGWAVVTMRKLANTPGSAYDVRVEQQFTQQYIASEGNDMSQTSGFESRRGTLLRMPANTDPNNFEGRTLSRGSQDWIELKKCQDGRSVSWLEVRIGPAASKNEANAQTHLLCQSPRPSQRQTERLHHRPGDACWLNGTP